MSSPSSSSSAATKTPSIPPPPASSDSAVHVSSPLNPVSPHTPSPLSFSSPLPPTDARGRGSSVSTLRCPPSAGSPPPLWGRVASPPVRSSPTLTVTDLPSTRRRSKSPSFFDENVWKKATFAQEQGSPTLHSSHPSTWWDGAEDIFHRPWKESPKRQNTVPPEQTETWTVTRERVIQASKSILGAALDVTHEALVVSVDLLDLVPIPGLSPAARTLLNIWDALQLIDLNRLQCLRLTERCADILISVREEVNAAGNQVRDELRLPLSRLMDTFDEIHAFLKKQANRPFLKRYLKRDEILRQISGCDAGLQQALEMFSVSIQIRILKQVQLGLQRQELDSSKLDSILSQTHSSALGLTFSEGGRPAIMHLGATEGMPASSSHTSLSDSSSTILPSVPVPFPSPYSMSSSQTTASSGRTIQPPAVDPSLSSSTVQQQFYTAPSIVSPSVPSSIQSPSAVIPTLVELRAKQNELDAARDAADLRTLLRTALASGNDAAMVSILGVRKEEMAEAIKTMQRALERMIEVEAFEEGWEKIQAARAAVQTQVFARVQQRDEGVDAEKTKAKGSSPTRGIQKMVRRISMRSSPLASPPMSPPTPDKGKEREEETLPRSRTTTSYNTDSTSSTGTTGGRSRDSRDTLDREFIEGSIDALRRLSQGKGATLSLPAWTITRYEVDREQKIGVGFFSDVYKGTWRGKSVAIKVLVDTTPRDLFIREVEIWKELRHPHILELYGASSTTGDPPWFFVSPYAKNGSLSEYLRRGAEGMMMSASRSRAGSTPVLWNVGHSASGSLGSIGTLAGGRERESSLSTVIFTRGRSPSITEVGAVANGGKELDLTRFMHEIAKGMEYLHEHGVLHGDLKASNVLVDDKTHCVITDFGQSEMKSEAYRISGTQPPHGTARWQAPEIMFGVTQATIQMDVYAFAITCTEILSMGRVPWPLLDDDGVRDRVLRRFSQPDSPLFLHRPETPPSRHNTLAIQEMLNRCWDDDPSKRPHFSTVVKELAVLRKLVGGSMEDVSSPRLSRLPEFEAPVSRPSPPMVPMPLPQTPPREPGFIVPGTSPDSFTTARDSSQSPPLRQAPSDDPVHDDTTVEGLLMPEPVIYTPSRPTSSRTSSMFTSTPSVQSEDEAKTNLYEGYDSPPPADEGIAAIRDERRYRMLLSHVYHPSLTLPLWTPSFVALGAVGYLSKPKGQFVTLLNALHPHKSDDPAVRAMPSIRGFGDDSGGSQRLDRRSATRKVSDAIAGLLTFRNRNEQRSQSVSRRETFPLRAGHKTAYLYTESSVYQYIENLDAPKKWFKANVDTVLRLYGVQHRITKEDLFLVIGTLHAENYALFVSHNHPDGQAHFNVYSAPKKGQPWGTFTTDTEVAPHGPSYNEEIPGSPINASKVSRSGMGWDSVLLARLRFKTDSLEPTSL